MSLASQPNGLGWAVIIVLITLASITTVTFVLRVYVQSKILKRRGTWEDYFAALGWILFLVFSGLTISAVFYGLGKPVYPVPPPEAWIATKLSYFHELTFILANMAIKQSIALMLLRYAVEDYHKRLIYLVTFGLQIYSMILFFFVMLQCVPVSYFWTRARGDLDGRCMDPQITIRLTYGYSATFVLYDLTMAILPWFMVRKLQLDLRTRLMVTTVLAFGSIACVVTIVRVPFIIRLSDTSDFLRRSARVSILSCCETGLSFATSCAVTLKPLFKRSSSQGSNRAPAQALKLVTIPTTTNGSSLTSTTKQGDVEFSTACYSTDSTKY